MQHIELKSIDFGIDQCCGSVLLDPKTYVRYVYIHRMTTLLACSIQPELATWCNLVYPNSFYLMAMIYPLYL